MPCLSSGWKCCKPRVLTFEEFMSIPPCTEGKHSTTDLPPKIEKKEPEQLAPEQAAPPPPRGPITVGQVATTPPPPQPESEDDDPAVEIPDGKTCRRRGCGATYDKSKGRSVEEKCVHHPGAPIFHEGSKGYSCCKRRVLEFDQFMKIEGCKTKDRHLFVGSGKEAAEKAKRLAENGGEEVLETVRYVMPFVRALCYGRSKGRASVDLKGVETCAFSRLNWRAEPAPPDLRSTSAEPVLLSQDSLMNTAQRLVSLALTGVENTDCQSIC